MARRVCEEGCRRTYPDWFFVEAHGAEVCRLCAARAGEDPWPWPAPHPDESVSLFAVRAKGLLDDYCARILVARPDGCPRCRAHVPGWFIERVDGDVCDLPYGIFGEGVFGPIGDQCAKACFHCTNAWPYPTAQQSEDDYVEWLKTWRREEEAKANWIRRPAV